MYIPVSYITATIRKFKLKVKYYWNVCKYLSFNWEWEVQSSSWRAQPGCPTVPGVNTNTLSGWLEEYQSCWSYLVVSILQASQDGIDQSGEIVVFNLLLSHTLSGIFTRCHIKKLAGVSRRVSQCCYLIKNNTSDHNQISVWIVASRNINWPGPGPAPTL